MFVSVYPKSCSTGVSSADLDATWGSWRSKSRTVETLQSEFKERKTPGGRERERKE